MATCDDKNWAAARFAWETVGGERGLEMGANFLKGYSGFWLIARMIPRVHSDMASVDGASRLIPLA
jgi:hypothetical protein